MKLATCKCPQCGQQIHGLYIDDDVTVEIFHDPDKLTCPKCGYDEEFRLAAYLDTRELPFPLRCQATASDLDTCP